MQYYSSFNIFVCCLIVPKNVPLVWSVRSKLTMVLYRQEASPWWIFPKPKRRSAAEISRGKIECAVQ